MAQDYVRYDADGEYGMIAINKSVFEAIASISVDDIENAVRIKNGRIFKAINVKIEKGNLNITAQIKVKYGANVNATAELLQNKIYENILYMTGYKASDVTVNVEGFELSY